MNEHNSPPGALDIHSHLLPSLDDGPEDYGQCLEVARLYRAIGVETVVATPHWIQGTGWAPDPELVRTRAAETETRLKEAGIALRILPGMEIAISDFLCSRFAAASLLSLGDSGTYLIEFPLNSAISAPTPEGIRTLRARQRENRFIIAHPERCALFQDNPARILEMVADGMLTQVNISSVLGYSGKKTQQAALALLDAGLVHFLATDSHGRAGRLPPAPEEMDRLAKLIGGDNVTAGFRENPKRMLAGENVPPLHARAAAAGQDVPATTPKRLVQSLRQLFREH